jgi:eukaryotic-like serine/threonine-protein kinase
MGAKPPTSSTQVARSSVDGAGAAVEGAAVEGAAGASTDVAGSLSDDATGEGNAARLLKAGEMVGRYCVRGLLGEGGMGRVYLARDMTLGRSVALKVLRRKMPGASPVERVVEEARTVASLNHPHVVQLYDVGEHGGSLYLALEYVEGETLQQRSSREALGVDEVLRAGRAIADALAHAHGVGVFHCDLKPGNVILGRDGRLRVVDFGLARTESTSASGRLEGTPDWMAPEQWTPSRLTDRVDVWALGLIMDRLLVGRRVAEGQAGSRGEAHSAGEVPGEGVAPNRKTTPSASGVLDDDALPEEDTVPRASVLPRPAERRSIPSLIEHLIGRSLEREPGVRPTAREWFEALDRLIEGREGGPLEEAPFRGLAAFDERHASFFFGREREIDAFLERLRVQPVLPIVGPSGAGKSSFLHAGVIPRLRARQATTVISFRPGRDPIGALARSVVVAGLGSSEAERGLFRREEADALARDLREIPTRIAARLATIAAVRQSSVLVAIDQLEELFTQGASEADARCFLELLFACTDDPRDPVRVIVTLRDDFLGRVPGLGAVYVLRGLRGDELRQAIAGPPRRCGYRFDDDGLIGEMLAEIGAGRAADLPLLQFACRALWDGRDAKRRLLLRSTYDAMGGVAGALAHHADGVLEAAPPHERKLIPRLLLRLVKGTTRQAVERSALLAGLPPEAESALDRLLSARLVAQRVAPDGAVSLEIAHESLLRAWGQLARWLDESHEERRLLAELEEAAQRWETRSCRPEETWPADDLLAVRRQASKLGLELPPPVERFLAAGEQHQRALQRRAMAWRAAAVVVGLICAVVVAALVTNFLLSRRPSLATLAKTGTLTSPSGSAA